MNREKDESVALRPILAQSSIAVLHSQCREQGDGYESHEKSKLRERKGRFVQIYYERQQRSENNKMTEGESSGPEI
jgi:hypothetical protein